VKRSPLLLIFSAVVLATSIAAAQTASRPPARTAMRPAPAVPTVALLDVSRIFKSHARFKAMMEDMKADVQRAESQIKMERGSIQKLAERLKEYRKGTPEYKSIEEDLTKRQANLRVRVELQRKEFLEQEAKIYHNVYQEILQEVDYYCASRGIAMVLRFNSEAVDAGRPEDVLRYINKPVVWHNRALDITQIVLENLNRRGGVAPHVTRPGVGTVPHTTRPGVVPYNPNR